MRLRVDRRFFLRSLLGGSLAVGTTSFDKTPGTAKLAFATLGCPDWTYEQIIQNAKRFGYDGVEFRGLKREFDLTKTTTFGSTKNISEALRLANDNNIKLICLGSLAVLHHSNLQQRRRNIDEAKRFVDLAFKLDCPYVRVFGDKFVEGIQKSSALIAEGMTELAAHADGSTIQILLSTHGDVSSAESVCGIMQQVAHKNTGIGWDILNTWYEDKKAPYEVYKKIKPYIRLVHVKDMSFGNGKETNVLLGRGQVPVFAGIDALISDGYDGYFSFVWEKHWFPDIEEPHIAFADCISVMKKHLCD